MPRGDCYEANGRFVLNALLRDQADDLVLVHAEVDGQGELEGRRLGHAWIENLDTGYAMDLSNDRWIALPIDAYRRLAGRITNEQRYTLEEMRQRIIKEENWGPWEDDS